MKYVIKDGWVMNKFVEGSAYPGDVVEIDGNIEDIIDSRGLPVYRLAGDTVVVATEEEIKSSKMYLTWIMANRLMRYYSINLLWFDYLYMSAIGDPKAEEKKQEAVAAVQRVKQEFPKQ